jgi:hypothetical protein
MFAATPAKSTRLTFFSNDPQEVLKLNMFNPKPSKVEVLVDGALVVALDVEPTLESPIGANAHSPQARNIYLVLRGAMVPASVLIQTTSMVQVTMTLDADIDDFFEDDVVENLSMLLEIPPDRIKVVNVRAGSVILTIEIYGPPVTESNSTNSTSNDFDEEVEEALALQVLIL